VDEPQQAPPHGAHVHLRPALVLLPLPRHGRWPTQLGVLRAAVRPRVYTGEPDEEGVAVRFGGRTDFRWGQENCI
jgi:hypothetical protein